MSARRRPVTVTEGVGADAQDQSGAARFFSVAEVAVLLGVSVYTIYGMISERRLPFRYHKFGRRVLVDRRDIDRWAATAGREAASGTTGLPRGRA